MEEYFKALDAYIDCRIQMSFIGQIGEMNQVLKEEMLKELNILKATLQLKFEDAVLRTANPEDYF